MTNKQVVERIKALRAVTRQTGCITRRTQSELLASLPDEQLLDVAAELKELFDKELEEALDESVEQALAERLLGGHNG